MFNKIFTIQKTIKILSTSSLILVLIIFIATGVFLYSNFYKIILQTEEIILIQSEALLEVVQTNLLNEVLKNISIKTKGGTIEAPILRNPFQ
jgi:hypothetical protein